MVIGMATFGESAPAKDLYRHFGITAERVVTAVHLLLNRAQVRPAHRHVEAPELPAHIVTSSN
jgi:transketolase